MGHGRTDASQHALARGTTVGLYQDMERSEDRTRIAEFLKNRFMERYIRPVTTGERHGFAMMALACLMIKALESFYRGWPNTKGRGKSEHAFCSFFDRNRDFHLLKRHREAFYRNVRCGILHQAETTGGWRILRSGDMFDPKQKVINATRFLGHVEKALADYCNELRRAEWNSEIWTNFRKKMTAICENCRGL